MSSPWLERSMLVAAVVSGSALIGAWLQGAEPNTALTTVSLASTVSYLYRKSKRETDE